jgi:DNA-binding SARP family transcriptional activator
MLALKFFGAGEAYYDGQPLPGFPNQQAYHLFCYLVLNRGYPLCRDRLAAVFWEDQPASTARKLLSKALWRLRNALQTAGAPADAYLLIDKDQLSFLESPACQLDIDIFDRAITRCQHVAGPELSEQQAADLVDVVSLYTGDLLEGVYEDWVIYERERLSVLHLKTLQKLMAYHEYHGAYEYAITLGERILYHDKAHEKTHQQMMRLHWLMGDRGAAMAQYKRCAQILKEETGFMPTPETKRLYQEMARNQYDPRLGLPLSAYAHTPPPSEEALQEMMAKALRKLSRLQQAVEETSTELHHLENLISLTLARTK